MIRTLGLLGLLVVTACVQEDERAKQLAVREQINRAVETQRAERAKAVVDSGAPLDTKRFAGRHQDRVEARSASEAEERRAQLRASCAQDRSQRLEARKLEDERRARSEKEREQRIALAEYRTKHCKRSVVGTPIDGDSIEVDEDGYLHRTRGVAAEVIFTCPADGPPGARGVVSAGIVRPRSDAVARLASTSQPARTRDDECHDADAEAASAP